MPKDAMHKARRKKNDFLMVLILVLGCNEATCKIVSLADFVNHLTPVLCNRRRAETRNQYKKARQWHALKLLKINVLLEAVLVCVN